MSNSSSGNMRPHVSSNEGVALEKYVSQDMAIQKTMEQSGPRYVLIVVFAGSVPLRPNIRPRIALGGRREGHKGTR